MQNKLPQGWVECQLKDIATVKGGKRLPAGAKYSKSITNYPYIRVTNFENMTVNTNDLKYLTPEIQNKIKNYTISKEDIYISIAGSIGKVGIIPDELDGANLTENAAKIIHCINKKFLTHILNSIEIQNQISTYTKSTTQPKLALYRIEELKILLPPMNEQRRIVEKIESEFAKIDEGLEHLENAKEQIKQYRQSVLKSAFCGKLTQQNPNDESAEILLRKINPRANFVHNVKLPQGWVECQLKDIGDIVSGGTPATKDADNFGGNIAWITPADLSDYKEKFISRGKRNITEKGLKNSSAKLMPKGSILFSSRAPIGYTVIAANPICTNQGFKNIVPCKYVFNQYIYYYLKSSKTLIEKYSSGTTFKEISGAKFGLIPFPFPPQNEQKQIVEEIEKRFAVADEVEKVVEDNIEKAKQLKQSILKKAFEGRLVPQDPNDKPATMLLEKIKQERSKNAK